MLVHEGGLVIETPAAPDSPAALRTVVQLDGDRLTAIAMGAITSLTPEDRQRLVARHLADVRMRSVGLLADGQVALRWLRHLMLAGAAGLEVFSTASHLSLRSFFATTEWRSLMHDQVACLVLLLCRQAAPVVLSHVLRLIHGQTARNLAAARHEDTRRRFHADQTAG